VRFPCATRRNIHVRSHRAGLRVKASITRFLTKKLKLKVNEDKSEVARPWERKFLGFSFTRGTEPKRCLASHTIKRFKRRVRRLTRRTRGVSLDWTGSYGYDFCGVSARGLALSDDGPGRAVHGFQLVEHTLWAANLLVLDGGQDVRVNLIGFDSCGRNRFDPLWVRQNNLIRAFLKYIVHVTLITSCLQHGKCAFRQLSYVIRHSIVW